MVIDRNHKLVLTVAILLGATLGLTTDCTAPPGPTPSSLREDLHATVDQLYEHTAALLIGQEEVCICISRLHLPKRIAEGDILKVTFEQDPQEKVKRRARRRQAEAIFDATLKLGENQ